MVTEREQAEEPAEAASEAKYDLHIEVPESMRQVLKDSAELAHEMEDIPKPDLINLMNLFISWGMAILKKKWLDRMGYK